MALVTEDGTGLATAESYLSVADFDTYWSLRTTDPVYTAASLGSATTTQKEEALRVSSQETDAEFETSWPGNRLVTTQALDWPRSSATYFDGTAISSSAVPTELESYIAERAARYIANIATGLIPDSDAPSGSLTREKLKAGPVEIDTTYQGGATQQKTFPKLDLLIQSILIAPGGSAVIRA